MSERGSFLKKLFELPKKPTLGENIAAISMGTSGVLGIAEGISVVNGDIYPATLLATGGYLSGSTLSAARELAEDDVKTGKNSGGRFTARFIGSQLIQHGTAAAAYGAILQKEEIYTAGLLAGALGAGLSVGSEWDINRALKRADNRTKK